MLNTPFFEQRFKIIGNYTVFTQQLLGKGATAHVYRGEHKLTKLPVAVKAIDLSKINDEASRSLLQNEKAALKCLSGPNLLKLEDIIQDHGFCYIVTSLCEGKTLKQYLKQQNVLNEKQAMSIFRKIVSACLIFSQQCIIHRDLKPANIMIDTHGEIKIIDFGYCQIIRAQQVMKTFNVGSPSYMSPQAYSRTLYSQKSDSWALGIILFEMLHGQTLDRGLQTPLYFQQLKAGPQLLQSKLSKSISTEVIQIIKKALQYLPGDRTSISNLKYQADVYHLKHQKQQSQSSSPSKQFIQPFHYSRQHQPIMHSAKIIIKPQHDQNRPSSKGFVSYEDFTKNRISKESIEKIQHKTSLEDFDAMSSKKNSQERPQKIAVDPKLQKFLYNVVKQNDHSRPASIDNIQNQHKPLHSARQIGLHPHYPLPPPPRKVTVRFV